MIECIGGQLLVVLFLIPICAARNLQLDEFSIQPYSQSCKSPKFGNGASYDLTSLRVTDSLKEVYILEDESDFSYVFNFCSSVTAASRPNQCRGKTEASILQYDTNGNCYSAGYFIRNSETWALIDDANPAKGVSLSYGAGDLCDRMSKRDATIDVYCANTEFKAGKAQEPRTCSYHLTVESYYGCPAGCAISDSGLCSGHGECAWDSDALSGKCVCDDGYSGDDCSTSLTTSIADPIQTKSVNVKITYSTTDMTWRARLFYLGIGAAVGVLIGILYAAINHLRRRRAGYLPVPTAEAEAIGNHTKESIGEGFVVKA